MSTVTLTTVWLNLASDPSDYVSFPTLAALSVAKETPGEVRRYAGGRTRVVRRAGHGRTASLDLPHSTRAEIDWIEQHVGDVVCVRDDRGRKFFAAYLIVDVAETAGNVGYGSASLALTEVSFSEAV